MFRFNLAAAAFAGILALIQPVIAETVVAAASDRAQTAPVVAQPAPAPTTAPSDGPAQAATGFFKDMVPVGFGWG